MGINDEEYKELGVKTSNNDNEILNSPDIIIQLGLLNDEKISNYHKKFEDIKSELFKLSIQYLIKNLDNKTYKEFKNINILN